MERESDQAIKDRQVKQVDDDRRARSERLGHDIREQSEPKTRRQNIFDALKK